MNLLHRFFWEAARTRRTVYAIAIPLGVAYASLRSLVFHVPEKQASVQLIELVILANVLGLVFFCVRGLVPERLDAIPMTSRMPRIIVYGGVAACMVLLTAPQVSISTVQASIVDLRLQRAANSIAPENVVSVTPRELQTRFRNVADLADTGLGYRIPAKSDLLEEAKNNLETSLKKTPLPEDVRRSGVSAFVALAAYADASNVFVAVRMPMILLGHGKTGKSMISQVPLTYSAWWEGSPQGSAIIPIPPPDKGPVFPVYHSAVFFNRVDFMGFGIGRGFIGTDGESQVAVLNATIQGATQTLDSIVWQNVTFKASVIEYKGGPLYLGNVLFENCIFRFSDAAENQKLLAEIQDSQGKPVTLVSGLSSSAQH